MAKAEIDEEMENDLKSLRGMASRLKLEGDEATKYVRDHMKRLGYEVVASFKRPEKTDSGKKSGGGWFGSSDDDDDI